jgi:integrase
MILEVSPPYEIQDRLYLRDSAIDEAHRRHAFAIALQLTRLGPIDIGTRQRCIRSIRSQHIFANCLAMFARFLEVNRAGNLKRFPPDAFTAYLYARSQRVGEAQLISDYWALELWTGVQLPRFKSARPQCLKPRAYTAEQIAAIAAHQTEPYAFSTWLAAAIGLRGMELITIAPLSAQPRDPRPIPPYLHAHMPPGELYSVYGKGGLIRTVLVPMPFVDTLEARLRPTPIRVRHERSDLTSYYDIPGGKRWAASFTQACRRTFNKTAGAHGLRHTYTQDRIDVLLGHSIPDRHARKAVSVEIGHFRLDVIKIYLRGRWDPTA